MAQPIREAPMGAMQPAATTVDALVESEQPRTWFGARLDLHAVRRDAVLAGVFSGANALAGTMSWAWFVPGMLFGAVLGMVLHLLPAEPDANDAWQGRIIVRAICGLVGGAWAGLGFAFVATGYAMGNAPEPTIGDVIPSLLVGGLTGSAWYVAWGFWETRRLRAEPPR